MIKTILVPASGTSSDESVFKTALALATPLGAHLAFHHVRLSAADAALRRPHMAYCVATGLPHAIEDLAREATALAAMAKIHVMAFCRQHGLIPDWSEGAEDPEQSLLVRVRCADLTVLGRPRNLDHMPIGLIEKLLLQGGRPLVIASDEKPPAAIETILVGWQDKPEAARALAAALPLLKIAKRVILTEILRRPPGRPPLDQLARHLERHGIRAEIRQVIEPFRPAEAVLPARAAEWGADLLVIGGYGKGPLREALFGGMTHTIIEGAPIPVFLLH